MSETKRLLVIGLGSFGSALATRLHKNECRVTGLDHVQEKVEDLKDVLYEAVIGDATERETLEHLSVDEAHTIFISLGADITPSLLATLHAKELGARRIIVKGVSPEHERILKCLGVERVIFPKVESARRLADTTAWPNVLDYVPIDPEYTFVEIAVPESFVDRRLLDLQLRREHGVWVVGVKDILTQKLSMFPDGGFRLGVDQLLLVVGKQADVARLREAE